MRLSGKKAIVTGGASGFGAGIVRKFIAEGANVLEIDADHWLYMTQHFESSFKILVGSVYTLRKACEALGYKRMPGRAACESLF